MMRIVCVLLLALGLSSCGKFYHYDGPQVTQIVVNKGQRKMYLLHHDKVLRAYNVGLGFAPSGDKKIRGDGKTPEGNYYIDRRNPNSQFYLSLGISYPNRADIAEARRLGKSAGGDIFIHGRPNKGNKGLRKGPDWTAGCIAVTNMEMREMYAMIRTGTPIQINP